MSLNPLKEKGIPLEKQVRSWRELNIKPYDKNSVHPYTQCRIIFMNGIEVESAMFLHQFARNISDMELKRQLGFTRRIEQQQQKIINWLMPAEASILEATVGYEQVAVDLTSYLARTVPNPYVKQVFDFGLLEDFDHLYRYANLMQLTEGKEAEAIVKQYTEVIPGRPTIQEHRHPFDEIKKPINRLKGDPLTTLYILTLVAAEQQTMNFYMNMGNRIAEPVGRGLYLEIAQIEEQHVTQYESLLDSKASMYEMNLMHEYNECYLYYSMMEQETDNRVKHIWERHFGMELEHLRIAAELFQAYSKKEPESILPEKIPDPILFESNVDYVRNILDSQVELTAKETQFVTLGELPKAYRYFEYNKLENDKWVPSEKVIEDNIRENRRDYRLDFKSPEPTMKDKIRAAARKII